MHIEDSLPTRVLIDSRPFHLFADGTLLPVISGGDGSTEGGGGEGDGDGSDGDGGELTIEQQLAAVQAEAEKWKAHARKHESQAKANADAAAKLKELEHSGKSETEKLQIQLKEQAEKARDANIKALKLQVAADKGLPPQLAKFLPDLEDEVDMLAAADELLEATGSAGTGDQPKRPPKSPLTAPLADDEANSRDALIRAMSGSLR